MADNRRLTHPITRWLLSGRYEDLDDARLIATFCRTRDPLAFEQIVHRHGPMVLGVCRRLCLNPGDADDAFQATFLILLQRIDRLTDPARVAGFLHQTAWRTARRASSRRPASPIPDDGLPDAAAEMPLDRAIAAEVRGLIDGGVNSLPSKLRLPVVLCFLEGRSKSAAALALGVPEGTISSRLHEARDKLRRWLSRRGVTVSSLAIGPVLFESVASAGASATVAGLMPVVLQVIGGVSVSSAAPASVVFLLTGGKTMFGTIKAAVLAAGLLAVGGGIGVQSGGDGSKTGPGAGSGRGDAVAKVERTSPKADVPERVDSPEGGIVPRLAATRDTLRALESEKEIAARTLAMSQHLLERERKKHLGLSEQVVAGTVTPNALTEHQQVLFTAELRVARQAMDKELLDREFAFYSGMAKSKADPAKPVASLPPITPPVAPKVALPEQLDPTAVPPNPIEPPIPSHPTASPTLPPPLAPATPPSMNPQPTITPMVQPRPLSEVGPKQLRQKLSLVEKRIDLAKEAVAIQQANLAEAERFENTGAGSARGELGKARALLIEKRDRVLILEGEIVEIRGQLEATDALERNLSLPMPVLADPLSMPVLAAPMPSERFPVLEPDRGPAPPPLPSPKLGVPVRDSGPAPMARNPGLPVDAGPSPVPFVAPEPRKKSEATQKAEAEVEKLTELLKVGAVTGLDVARAKFFVTVSLMADEHNELTALHRRVLADLKKAGAVDAAKNLEEKIEELSAQTQAMFEALRTKGVKRVPGNAPVTTQ